MSIVSISTDSDLLVEPVVKHPKSENTFDEYKYEDEVLNEAKGYFTKETLDEPTTCLANIEELLAQKPDSEDIPIEESLEKSLNDASWNWEKKNWPVQNCWIKKIFCSKYGCPWANRYNYP
ncbi:42329_t:CDS:2 [Gigaspora margarita]|uniref:42329_t:CDS:1 n=1 Tax=Gigaspora margarita TaxID=4874 RepID=A0ABN7VJH4_GIGMA|nr:42329_t:CDS:2 [Gigaspora margarita]